MCSRLNLSCLRVSALTGESDVDEVVVEEEEEGFEVDDEEELTGAP